MYRDWVAGYQCTMTGWPRWPCGKASASSAGDTSFAPCCHRTRHVTDFSIGCLAAPRCSHNRATGSGMDEDSKGHIKMED